MFTYLRRASACVGILLVLLPLAACGGSPAAVVKATPTPSPTSDPGQQLLAQVAHTLGTASTLHAIFDISLSGASFKGRVKTEIWNAAPNKNRTVVLQSSIAQYPTGSVTVSDGKQVWVYDPAKNVAYKGPAPASGSPGSGGLFGGGGTGQSQLVLNLVQTIFTNSKATLVSSSASAHGHSAYDVHVVPGTQSAAPAPGGSGLNNLNYDGDIFIDKATSLPVLMNLGLQGFAQVQLDIPQLILNQPVPAGTFTFIVPPGAKVRPLVQASPTSDTGATTLAQAQQQAGYHLLSIPSSQTAYQLVNVNVLGASGNLVFTLNYIRGGKSFSLIEARSLANVPASGQQLSLRGTTATFSTAGGAPILAWAENGVGLRITGSLSEDEAVTIAKLLS
ncbi:MAG: hypothetical protein M3Z08_24295 [Chloroflexota bacterium]|nr:hypothetical protein [Chloroflexota bacterium]